MFIAALFTIAKCWKQPKCPLVYEWIKKLWYIYTLRYYTAERKKELLPFMTTWKELESVMLSEISQVVKDKYHMIFPFFKVFETICAPTSKHTVSSNYLKILDKIELSILLTLVIHIG